MTITVGENQKLDASISHEMVVLYHTGLRDPFGVIRLENPEEILAVDGSMLRRLHRTTADWVTVRDVSLREIRARLGFEKCLTEAHGLVETILNPTEGAEQRRRAARLLEEHLHLSGLEERLENLLYSPTTPASGSLEEAIKLTDQGATRAVHELLVKLEEHRGGIGVISLAWGIIRIQAFRTPTFDDRGSKKRLEVILTRLGVFRRLAQGEDFQTILEALRTSNPEVASLTNFNKVMRSWQHQLSGSRV